MIKKNMSWKTNIVYSYMYINLHSQKEGKFWLVPERFDLDLLDNEPFILAFPAFAN